MTKRTAKNSADLAKSPPFSPRRGSTLPSSIQDDLTELAKTTRTQAAIYKEVLKRYGHAQSDKDGTLAPHGLSQRTVEGFVKQVREEMENSGRTVWTLIDDDTGEPAIVLETLAEVISHTSGGVTAFEVEEAQMVARIGKAFPTLPVLDRWSLAILYVVRRWQKKRTDDIDTYLAFAPWENDEDGLERQYNYERAQRLGWVPEQPRPLSSDLRRVNLNHVDLTADWIEAKQQIARALAQPGAHWVLGEPLPEQEQRRFAERLFGSTTNPAEGGAVQHVIDQALPKRGSTWKIGDDPRDQGDPVDSEPVSNPVSNESRSATVQLEP